MAPPRILPPRPPAKKTRDQIQDEQIALLKKKTQALATFNYMFIDVTSKAQDLRAAAVRIGKAYALAAKRHRDAVAKQNQVKALETQLMFSVLTVLSAGALSWATEMIKTAYAAKVAVKMSQYERILGWSKQSGQKFVLRDAAKVCERLKSELTRQVSVRELLTTVTNATLTSGLGEVISEMGPLTSTPATAAEPAGLEPLVFQDELVAQIDAVHGPALHNLGKMAGKIKSLPDEAWAKYDDQKFQKAYQKWQQEADKLASVNDLPSESAMTDELERFIWALWMPSLKVTKVISGGCNEAGCWESEEVDVYEPLTKPVNERLVALGIETKEQTDWRRDKEDQMLIAWAEKYLQEVKPWVGGKVTPAAAK